MAVSNAFSFGQTSKPYAMRKSSILQEQKMTPFPIQVKAPF
jgi:hypothetical protein